MEDLLQSVQRTARASALSIGLLVGCQPTSARIAHQGGAAYWPENSRSAVAGSLERDWPASHFDVFLTLDRQPVLNAEPFLDPALCRTVGERPIDEVWLLQTSFDALHAGYRCGGLPDPDHDDARVVEDTVVPLQELISALEALPSSERPDVHLTAGFFPNVSHDPAVYAAEILGRWAPSELDDLPVIGRPAGHPRRVRTHARQQLHLQTTRVAANARRQRDGWAATAHALGTSTD